VTDPTAWNLRATGYDSLEWVNGQQHLAPIASLLAGVPDDGLVVDLGCGTGALSEVLASRFARGCAADLSPVMVEATRKRLANARGWDVRLGDANIIETFMALAPTGIASRMLLHQPEISDPRATVRRWCATVKPGGWVLVVEGPPPVDDWTHPAAGLYRLAMEVKEPGRHFLTPSQIAGWMREGGCQLVQTVEWYSEDNSLMNWLRGDPSLLSEELGAVVQLHQGAMQCEAVREAYRMQRAEDGDVLMRWRHCAVLGRL